MISLPDGVEIARLSPQKIDVYWNLLKDHGPSFEDGTRSREWLQEHWMDLHWVVLEVEKNKGVIVMDSVVAGHKAEVHVHFFDHKLSKRLGLLKDCLIWAFLQFDLKRVEFRVPEHAPAVRRFLKKRMGATEEGCLRQYALYEGEAKDLYIYSILRDEVLQ